jgi:putative addiction module antidote
MPDYRRVRIPGGTCFFTARPFARGLDCGDLSKPVPTDAACGGQRKVPFLCAANGLAFAVKRYYDSNNNQGAVMVELKVRKFGNSLGVVLPKEVILHLNTKDGERLYLTEAPEGGYRLVPYDPAFERKMAKAEDIISRYRNTLHVLAQ